MNPAQVTPNPVSAPQEVQAGDWLVPWRFAVALGLLLVLTFPKVLAGSQTFAYLDFGQFAYPVAFYHREAFWRGELPLWNPLSSCGVPFLAQWNTLACYPLSLVYLLLPFPWSVNLFCLGHLFLAGMGMWLLTHRWTGNRLAAAVAGLIFAFNGLTWYGLMWPHLTAALAWMPWVVLAMQRAWLDGGRWMIVAGLAGAMQMLSGGAEVIILTWLLLGTLWVAELLRKNIPLPQLIARGLLPSVLVVGLAAVQLLPFLDLLGHSQRSSTYGSATLAAMPLTGWANFLVPIFHCARNPQGLFVQPDHWTGSYYLGVGCVALAILAVWRNAAARDPANGDASRSRRVWVLLGLTLFSLVMALGARGLLYTWATQFIPVLGFIRFPVKFVMLTTFTMPLLAGEALAALQRSVPIQSAPDWRRLTWVAAALIAAIGIIILLARAYPAPGEDVAATTRNAITRAAFLVIVAGCLFLLRRQSGLMAQAILQLSLLALFWVDVRTHNANLTPTLPPAALEADAVRNYYHWNDELAAGRSRLLESRTSFRTMLAVGFADLMQDTASRRLSQFFDYNLLDHVAKFDGFYSLDLKEYSELFQQVYASTNACPGLLDFLGISHMNNPPTLADWTPRSTCLPLVTAGQAPVFVEPDGTLRALLSDSFDPRRQVFLPSAARGTVHATGPANARIEGFTFASTRLSMSVIAEAPAMVVVAQAFYHPWHAFVDGKPVPLWRANYAFQALEVPAGPHHVELFYRDHALLWGAGLSIACLALCAIGWLRGSAHDKARHLCGVLKLSRTVSTGKEYLKQYAKPKH